MGKQDGAPVLHCNIDEKAFSKAMFLCRFFTGAAMVYFALGSLFYWREFLVNTAALGLPWPVSLAFFFIAAELFLGLFLLLGWHTRVSAAASLPLVVICAIIFFAGEYNKAFAGLCILACAPLCTLLLLGPGIFSLDYKRSLRAARRFFRG